MRGSGLVSTIVDVRSIPHPLCLAPWKPSPSDPDTAKEPEEEEEGASEHLNRQLTESPQDPPQLNWIYIDASTHAVKYGSKAETEDQRVGPWNCTKVDHRMTFDGWEGFLAYALPPSAPSSPSQHLTHH